MRVRVTMFLLALIVGPFEFLQTAAAQDDHAKSSPLSVRAEFSSEIGATCDSGQGLVAQLHYAGTQPLRGYLIRFNLADSVTGKVLPEQTVQEIRDLSEPMIVSVAEWTRTVCSKLGNISADHLTVTGTVDVLKFADNSTWGPIALRESSQLIGTLDGMDFIAKTTDLKRFVSPILPKDGPLPVEDVEWQTIGPLRFESGVWHDERDQDMLAVEVTNESDRSIRGYVFTESFLDPATGNRIRRVTTKELETQGNPSDYLAPGAAWVAGPRKFSHLSDGTLAAYTITLDFVVFADGPTFGPKRSRESDEVLGMFRGIDAAKLLSLGNSANQVQ
jgi:hypothetical protein